MPAFTVILSRQTAPDAQAAELERQIIADCCKTGLKVLAIPHLYHISKDAAIWEKLAKPAAGSVVLLSWLHPRAAEWVLRSHHLTPQHVTALNLATFSSPAECLAAIRPALGDGALTDGNGEVVSLDESISARWYPVVDKSRCDNCCHCLQFCLFGVFATDENGKLVVSHPDQCKAGCPACSRICPNGAIIFPLYEKSDAIAGAPGELMSPDLPARRMFYSRTGKPCPVCGNKLLPGVVPASGEHACPECGGPAAKTATSPVTQSNAFDDLDKLVDELDQTMKRRG